GAPCGGAGGAVGQEVALPARSSLALAGKLCAAGSSPSQQLARQEVARRVRRAVGQLPEEDREILLLRDFEGLSNPEIGLILDLDAGVVSKRHGRALLRLRKLLLDTGLTEYEP